MGRSAGSREGGVGLKALDRKRQRIEEYIVDVGEKEAEMFLRQNDKERMRE